jgi:secernin
VSIRTEWQQGSADLEAYARSQGWWNAKAGSTFDFAQSYIDEHTARQVSHIRAMRSRQLLEERHGEITPQWMMRMARDHYEGTFLQGTVF